MNTKEYQKQWYQNHKEEYRQKYQNNKEEIKTRSLNYYYNNKEKHKAYHDAYYQKNKKRIDKYYKAYINLSKLRNSKTMLKARHIQPDEKDMELMTNTVKLYAAKVYRQTGRYTDYQDYIGAGYESLCVAINICKPGLNEKNRNMYLFHKIKFGIIDIYRCAYGRKGSGKQPAEGVKITSIYFENNGEDEVFQIPADNIDLDIKIDADFFQQKIKKEMLKLNNGRQLYNMWVMKTMHSLTFVQIAEKINKSDGSVSQYFSRYINPAFERAKKDIQEAYGQYYC